MAEDKGEFVGDFTQLPKDHYVTAIQFTKNVYQDIYPAVDPKKAELNLKGKTVVITGASRGIGKLGIIPAFIKAGVKGIALLASSASKLAETEAEVKNSNPEIEILTFALDISNIQAVTSTFEKIKSKFGHADILVGAAGAMSGDGLKLHETDPEKWWRNFEVNGKGNYLLVRAFLQLLPTPETKASIILLTTFQSLLPMPPLSGYFLSKSIVDNLCSYIAADYPNVTAVSLHPGLVKTDMLKEPVRSMFNTDSPELIGGVAVWLCGGGEGRSWLSGRFVSVNWDVEELEQRREEIGENDLLKMTLKGKFGKDAVALK